MKKVSIIFVLLAVFFCMNIYSGYSQVVPASQITPASTKIETRTSDVNNDGKPDVTYYSDGKYVSKAEADTNYDGKPDITLYTENGKFKSAEVDTNYDGKIDKEFNDVSEFNKWLNENHSDFEDRLNKANWQFNLISF